MICSSETLLSEEKDDCISDETFIQYLDENCEESVLEYDYTCSSCSPGFYFNEYTKIC